MPLYTQPPVRIIASSAVAVSGAADTNENTLATITVPAGAMGTNGTLRITTMWTITSSANNKTLRVRFSGASGTQYANLTYTTSASCVDVRYITNRTASTQVGSASARDTGLGGSSVALVTSSVDTTATTTVVITGQKGLGSETLTLDSYLVELIIP